MHIPCVTHVSLVKLTSLARLSVKQCITGFIYCSVWTFLLLVILGISFVCNQTVSQHCYLLQYWIFLNCVIFYCVFLYMLQHIVHLIDVTFLVPWHGHFVHSILDFFENLKRISRDRCIVPQKTAYKGNPKGKNSRAGN